MTGTCHSKWCSVWSVKSNMIKSVIKERKKWKSMLPILSSVNHVNTGLHKEVMRSNTIMGKMRFVWFAPMFCKIAWTFKPSNIYNFFVQRFCFPIHIFLVSHDGLRRVNRLLTLSLRMSLATLWRKLISRAWICDLLEATQRSLLWVRAGMLFTW